MTGVLASQATLPAGGGPFDLGALIIGVFLSEQPSHRLSLGSNRARHLPIGRHEGWILPPGSAGICSFDAPLDLVTVEIGKDLLREVGISRPEALAPTTGTIDGMIVQLALNAPAFGDGSTLYRETMQRALAARISHVLQPVEGIEATMEDVRLRRVVAYIRDNLDQDISLDDLAGIAAMSPYHFARAFKAAAGASPLQYVIGERMDRAWVLLRTTRLTVAEIAHRCGYADLSRFGAHFKRAAGATPRRFREV